MHFLCDRLLSDRDLQCKLKQWLVCHSFDAENGAGLFVFGNVDCYNFLLSSFLFPSFLAFLPILPYPYFHILLCFQSSFRPPFRPSPSSGNPRTLQRRWDVPPSEQALTLRLLSKTNASWRRPGKGTPFTTNKNSQTNEQASLPMPLT